jgi:uncharacterized protein (DUF2236 family)
MFNRLIEMLAAHRDVDKDWSDFESYATNVYVRSLLNNQVSSNTSSIVSVSRHVPAALTDSTKPNARLTSTDESKSVLDEIVSIRKGLVELRSQSENVSRM